MTDADFPEELRSFIQDAIPSLDAAELLLMLARGATRAYTPREAVNALRPTALTEADARRYLAHFQTRGIVAADAAGGYRYAGDGDLDRRVQELTRVFNERPVTLVRLIYAGGDEKIRSFAEAFRIKK